MKIQGPDRILLASKKKNSGIIFVDIDGVLSDWLNGACKLCGIDEDDPDIRKQLKSGKQLENFEGQSPERLWTEIEAAGEQWWASLDLLPWAKKLVTSLQKVTKVCLLSSPGKEIATGSLSAAGKILWIGEHFPDVPFILTYYKELCAGPDRLLVDDSAKKIKKFKAAGGKVFHWPIQYEMLDGDKDIEEVISSVKDEFKKK